MVALSASRLACSASEAITLIASPIWVLASLSFVIVEWVELASCSAVLATVAASLALWAIARRFASNLRLSRKPFADCCLPVGLRP
jgi:hypothetical protein